MMRLEGKIALVTGSAHGIGKAVALRLAEQGADLVLVDVDAGALAEVVAQVEASGRRVLSSNADVTLGDEVEALVEKVLGAFGRVDLLINNVGGSRGPRQIEATQEEDFDEVVRLNLKSTFLVTRAIIPSMKRQGSGRIVNVASVAAKVGSLTGSPAYSAAKAGVLGFTRHAAAELAPFHITVNAVAPGVTQSERMSNRLATWSEEERRALVSRIPLGRLATVQEVAAAIVFLCGEEAGYITGATVDVNGGVHMA
ncbi:MAG TPA: SDR family NAD(P)-dependent oxidoreductase [Anaerolineales bacterium]|nr:SDR family NAD(P)-dependent oxidoreductase [Anaerolineales bacterium]